MYLIIDMYIYARYFKKKFVSTTSTWIFFSNYTYIYIEINKYTVWYFILKFQADSVRCGKCAGKKFPEKWSPQYRTLFQGLFFRDLFSWGFFSGNLFSRDFHSRGPFFGNPFSGKKILSFSNKNLFDRHF